MKKLIVTVLIAVLFVLSSAIPSFAAEYTAIEGSLTETQKSSLQANAEGLKEKYGIDVYLLESEDEGSAQDMADNFIESNNISDHYVIFCVTADFVYFDWSDDLNLCFSYGTAGYVWDKIEQYEEDLYELSCEFYSLIDTMLGDRLNTPYKYVRDQAGVLSDAEEKVLNEKLTALSEKHELDIVFLTANGVEYDELIPYADDYYDYEGYGYGDDRDGVLLLVNIGSDGYSRGNSYISARGKGSVYISDEDIQDIGEKITPLLLEGSYAEAGGKFGDLVSREIGFENFFGILIVIGVTLIVCVIAAFIYTGKLKRQLISVAAAANANNYLVGGSLNIRKSYDHYLYSNVTRTERQSSSGGNSSSHTSSSGATHTGGRF